MNTTTITTVCGCVAAACTAVVAIPGIDATIRSIAVGIGAVATALLGYFAKGKDKA